MNDPLDPVRTALSSAEDVTLPEGLQSPDPRMDEPHPDDDPYAGMEPDYGPDLGDPVSNGGAEPPESDNLRAAAALPINDLGNGQRLVLHFGPDLIFVPRVGWHVWDGTRWGKDPDMIEARRRAQRLSELVLAEVPYLCLSDRQMESMATEAGLRAELQVLQLQTDDEGNLSDVAKSRAARIELELAAIGSLKTTLSKMRTAHRTFARSTGNTTKIKAAMTEAEVPLATPLEALDRAPLDVNTGSGVLRFSLTRTDGVAHAGVELLAHDRALRMTKIMACAYGPTRGAPLFHAFLERIMPDPDMQRFVQRWFGYSMLGLTNEQALAFFYGMGANGKSAIVDLMARLMGDYAATAKIESLTGTNRRSGGDATPDLVPMINARMIRTSEPEKGVPWQEGLIKQLTGGEPILVRALQADFVEVTPIFKLTISGNHQPDIRGMDDGIWRRLMIVPFDVQIPKEERDPLIVQRMVEEGPGILNWLVEGALSYLEGGLAPPAQVMLATDTLRSESDPYGQFLDEACVITGDAYDRMSSREVMLAFMFWQMQRGETPFRERTITTNIKEHSRRWQSTKTKARFTEAKSGAFNGYDGIKLGDMFRREWDAAPKDGTGKAISVSARAEGGWSNEY